MEGGRAAREVTFVNNDEGCLSFINTSFFQKTKVLKAHKNEEY